MKTYFHKQLEFIKAMSIDNIADRMERCDILKFDPPVYITNQINVTSLRNDGNGIIVFDEDVMLNRLEAMSIHALALISDSLE